RPPPRTRSPTPAPGPAVGGARRGSRWEERGGRASRARGEERGARQAGAREAVADAGREAAEAVTQRTAESDRGRLGRVAGGAADLGDRAPAPQDLGQDLVVEHEVVRVALERHALEQPARERAVAGVELGEL